MADRTVKVNLVAQVNGYISGMEQAARKTRDLGSEAERLASKRQAFEDLGRPLLAFGAIAAAAVGIAIKRFADFDQAMSQVSAVTQESAANMELLQSAALAAGGATVFTATEAANAIEELGKAGLSTADILEGALAGALSLASAGELEVARAAEITATTLKQFGLDGTQAGHVADVLAAGAGKALGSVEDLAQALKFVGPVAASMGISLEETTGALALFADQGLIGEQAGTGLRGVLASLTSPSKEAATEITALGINLYNASGRFIGLENLAGKLGDAYQTMDGKARDASLGIIFGNQQVTAARVLFQGGAEAVAKYTAEVNDAGYAARVAADRLDNLKGDVEKLGGAFDTFLIKSGSTANDALRTIVQTLTFVVDIAGEVPEPMLAAGMAIGTVTAALALTGGAALIAVPRVAAFKIALDATGISARGATLAIGLVGGAIGLATFAITTFISKQAALAATGDALVGSLNQATGAFTDYSREIVANELIASGAADTAEKLGISLNTLTDAAFGVPEAMAEVDKAVAESALSGENNIQQVNRFTGEIGELRKEVLEAPAEFDKLKSATDDSTDSYTAAAAEVASLQSELNSLIETINRANGIGQDAVSTNAAYQAGLQATTTAVAEFAAANGVSAENINEATAAGSDNADMFSNLAAKSQEAAAAQLALDGNSEAYLATLGAGRQALYDQILALTGNADATQALIDKIYAIPTQAEVDILVESTEAQRRLDAINASLATFRASSQNLTAYIRTVGGNENGGLYQGGVKAFENGGFPSGIFPGTKGGIHKFAEESLPWEAYISPKPGERARNLDIWEQTGRMLGAPTGGGGGSSTVNMNVTAEDPAAASERVFQRLNAELMKL